MSPARRASKKLRPIDMLSLFRLFARGDAARGALASAGPRLYRMPRLEPFELPRCAHRLAVQDVALSRRKHGFDSRWARQQSQENAGIFVGYALILYSV